MEKVCLHSPMTGSELVRALMIVAKGIQSTLMTLKVIGAIPGQLGSIDVKAVILWERVNHRLKVIALNENSDGLTLLLSHYGAQKLAEQIRRWNETDNAQKICVQMKRIYATEAASFYSVATFKNEAILRAEVQAYKVSPWKREVAPHIERAIADRIEPVVVDRIHPEGGPRGK